MPSVRSATGLSFRFRKGSTIIGYVEMCVFRLISYGVDAKEYLIRTYFVAAGLGVMLIMLVSPGISC